MRKNAHLSSDHSTSSTAQNRTEQHDSDQLNTAKTAKLTASSDETAYTNLCKPRGNAEYRRAKRRCMKTNTNRNTHLTTKDNSASSTIENRDSTNVDASLSQDARQATHLIEPLPGYFIEAQIWAHKSAYEKVITIILALAINHPCWPVSTVSAAALLGAFSSMNRDLYRFVHFAADRHTSSKQRTRLPIRFHYIRQCRPEQIKEFIFGEAPTLLSDHPEDRYIPLTDTVGVIYNVIVTSPLQTMFDCMRMLPFEDAIIICDKLAKIYHITYRDILEFGLKRRGCWKAEIALFKAKFINRKSENGGESFCRARMVRAGLETPILQVEVMNPLCNISRATGPTFQRTRTIRPDFVWEISDSDSEMKYIAAELDGAQKYTNAEFFASTNAQSAHDVFLREKDRENALVLQGFRIVRFQFAEALYDSGRDMVNKLIKFGVRMVSKRERTRRTRLLARFIGEPTLMRLN